MLLLRYGLDGPNDPNSGRRKRRQPTVDRDSTFRPNKGYFIITCWTRSGVPYGFGLPALYWHRTLHRLVFVSVLRRGRAVTIGSGGKSAKVVKIRSSCRAGILGINIKIDKSRKNGKLDLVRSSIWRSDDVLSNSQTQLVAKTATPCMLMPCCWTRNRLVWLQSSTLPQPSRPRS